MPDSIPGIGDTAQSAAKSPLTTLNSSETDKLLSFPCGSDGKESVCNAGDLGSILGLGRSPGEGKGYPFQHSGLENSVNYKSTGSQSQTRLSDFHFHT